MLENFFGEEIEKTVFLSAAQMREAHPGPVRGKYFKDTAIFNIFPPELSERGELLGQIFPEGSEPNAKGFCGVAGQEKIQFYFDGKPIKAEPYELHQNIFSRNKGILETDKMDHKRAVILGCGSVGSLVAMELARSGVGHFLLADPDVMEYHNICRHQCGIEDVGDLKINALKRKLLNINPQVDVQIFEGIVQNIPKAVLDDFCVKGETVFVGCADNRGADVYANRISIYYGAAFLSVGFWERAYAGEIFYHIPGRGMPCYACALGEGTELSARVQANHHVYSNQENIEGVRFEPGISVDINFITCIGVKLCLDILNMTEPGYRPRLLNTLKQYTLVCNTSDPEIGGEMVEIFSYPLQVTTSLKVGFHSEKCPGQCRYEIEDH